MILSLSKVQASGFKEVTKVPIYKVGNIKKDGLQKYNVRINYMSDSGKPKQLTRTAYGLDAAKTLERELQQEIETGGNLQSRKMTVKQLYNSFMEMRKYEVRDSSYDKTERVYKLHILPILSDVRIDALSATILQKWKLSVEEKGLTLKTRQNIFSELRTMFNYAVRMEYISKNPLFKVGNFKGSVAIKKDIDFYTPEEFRKFITAAKKVALEKQKSQNSLYEWNYYVFFNIAFYTGLRKGEIHALKWSDIEGDYLHVRRSITQKLHDYDVESAPKNKSSIRTLQMPLPLIQVLNDHKKRQKELAGFSDDSRILGDGRCVRDSTIQLRNDLYASLAGVKRIRIHDFRHSHASLLANMGVNIQEVARRLGHAKVDMTWNTYSHLYPKEEEKAMTVLNAV